MESWKIKKEVKREINLLMNCLLPENKVIENNQTDGISIKEKQQAYKRVHSHFTIKIKDQFRDLISIKLKYDIKCTLRKNILSRVQLLRA